MDTERTDGGPDRTPEAATTALRAATLQRFAHVLGPKGRAPGAKPYRKRSAQIVNGLFQAALRETAVETLIECGAREASASRLFMEAGGGRAIAFEANPAVFEAITRNVAPFGVETRNIGLSDHVGEMTFHPLAEKPLAGRGSFRRKRGVETVPVQVPVTTVDRAIAEHGVSGPVALWVDVEGYAHEVLNGAAGALASGSCRLLKVEMEDHAHWLDQKQSDAVAALVERHGFVPVLCDFEYWGQFTTIYVHDQMLDRCATAIAAARKLQQALAGADLRP